MHKKEILAAIQEQTEAIKRQAEAIEIIAQSLDIDGLVKALVPAFVRELKRQEDMRLDAQYLASLPHDERKRRGHEEMMRQNREARERKAAEKAGG